MFDDCISIIITLNLGWYIRYPGSQNLMRKLKSGADTNPMVV